ncbi:hypothetical protein BC833DRAFT_579169 [Globomyces pollinis-pini]|nr:hypothetical protein BC833DRAFT_579169 [Globomyces pollinis-pini]
MHSESGFDIVSALVKIVTREDEKIRLGPIDLSCAFVVSDLRLPDLPIVYVSPSFEVLTGYSSAEILGRNCRFLQNPDGVDIRGPRLFTDDSIVSRMKNCIEEHQEGQFTLVNYKKNGTPFLNQLTMIPISMTNNHEKTHFIGLQIDLIQQPKAILGRMMDGTYNMDYRLSDVDPSPTTCIEEPVPDQICEKQTNVSIPSYLTSFIDIVPDFTFVLSLRGVFLKAPKHACMKTLQYDTSDLIGVKFSEFVHPSDLVAVQRDLRICSSEGDTNFICRMRRRAAGYVFMEMNAHVYGGSKRNRCIIVSGRERTIPFISSSTMLEPELVSDNETWLKLSVGGLFLFASKSCVHFFGYNFDDIANYTIFDFISPIDGQTLLQSFQSNMNQTLSIPISSAKGHFNCTFRILTEGNSLYWIQIKKNSMFVQFSKNNSNLFKICDASRSGSIHYECNRLNLANTRLTEEIERLQSL